MCANFYDLSIPSPHANLGNPCIYTQGVNPQEHRSIAQKTAKTSKSSPGEHRVKA